MRNIQEEREGDEKKDGLRREGKRARGHESVFKEREREENESVSSSREGERERERERERESVCV